MIANPKIPTVNGTPVPFKSPAEKRDNTRVICKIPCCLFSVLVDYNGASGTAYLLVFDGNQVPSNGMVPDLPAVPMTIDGFFVLDVTPGLPMFKGVAVALSTTRDVLTKIATPDAVIIGTYLPLDVQA